MQHTSGAALGGWQYDPDDPCVRRQCDPTRPPECSMRWSICIAHCPRGWAARIGGMFDCLATGSRATRRSLRRGQGSHGRGDRRVAARARRVAQQVLEDYLLTNDVGDFEQFIRTRHAAQLGLADAAIIRCSRCPMTCGGCCSAPTRRFSTRRSTEIDASLGGIDGYLERSAGVAAVQCLSVCASALIA